MRPIYVAAALLLAATASAGEDRASALQGKWKLDKALVAETLPGYAEASPEERRALKERLAQGMPDASVEFGATEVTFGFAPKPPETATYRVTARKGNRLHLEITSKDDRGSPKVDETIAELEGRDVLRLTRGDMPFALVLRRVDRAEAAMRTRALTVMVVSSVTAVSAGEDPTRPLHGKWREWTRSCPRRRRRDTGTRRPRNGNRSRARSRPRRPRPRSSSARARTSSGGPESPSRREPMR